MDETVGRANSEVQLPFSDRHHHDVAGREPPEREPTEMLQQCGIDLERVTTAQSVIVASRSRGDSECRKHDANAVEPFCSATLRAESSSDERAGALGIMDRHENQAPG
jgi:hypothetical protein